MMSNTPMTNSRPAPTKSAPAKCWYCDRPIKGVPTQINRPAGAVLMHGECVDPSSASAIANGHPSRGKVQYDAPIGPRPASIVDEVAGFIRRYVVLPSYTEAFTLALWTIHTHAFEVAYATPYIYVNSAEPECGKTRLLETLEYVARNASVAAKVTPSTLYREMSDPDSPKPTMLVDEVDALFSGSKNEDMRGILNSGYQHRGHIKVTLPGRNEDSDVVTMSTFCPKVLAGIDNGQLPPTLASRSITITLRRKRPDQDVARFLPRKVEPLADELQETITEWVKVNLDTVADYEPEFVDGIGDRAFQITEPLLQVAYAAGVEDEAREAIATLLTKPTVTLTQGQQVLMAAREWFTESDMDRVTTARLENATGFNGKLIGTLLAKYGIRPVTLNKGHAVTGDKNAKGYYLRDLADAIATYLPNADS